MVHNGTYILLVHRSIGRHTTNSQKIKSNTAHLQGINFLLKGRTQLLIIDKKI